MYTDYENLTGEEFYSALKSAIMGLTQEEQEELLQWMEESF